MLPVLHHSNSAAGYQSIGEGSDDSPLVLSRSRSLPTTPVDERPPSIVINGEVEEEEDDTVARKEREGHGREGLNITGWALMRDHEFWIFFGVVGLCSGTGLMCECSLLDPVLELTVSFASHSHQQPRHFRSHALASWQGPSRSRHTPSQPRLPSLHLQLPRSTPQRISLRPFCPSFAFSPNRSRLVAGYVHPSLLFSRSRADRSVQSPWRVCSCCRSCWRRRRRRLRDGTDLRYRLQ